MLLLRYLSETGRSTIISISSLIILIIESSPFGIILNLVAELGQLCGIDLRFEITTIYLLLLLLQIVEFKSMLSLFEETKDKVFDFILGIFPLFTRPRFIMNSLVTLFIKPSFMMNSLVTSKTYKNYWSRFVPLFTLPCKQSPIHTTLEPIFHFFSLLFQHLTFAVTLFMVDPNASHHPADKYNTSFGLPEYNPSTPPGWKPGLKNYPFRKYVQKMQLWKFKSIRVGSVAWTPLKTIKVPHKGTE